MSAPITTLYAAILALCFAILSGLVIFGRTKRRVAFGHGDDKALRHRIRGHANFAEYVPLALILMLLLELAGEPTWLLHVFGSALVASRVIHAAAFFKEPHNLGVRTAGTALTLTVVISAAIGCARIALKSLV